MPQFRFALPPRGSGARLPAMLVPLLAVLAAVQSALPDTIDLPPGGVVAGVAASRGTVVMPPVIAPASLALRSPFAPVAGPAGGGDAAADPLGGVSFAGVVRTGGSVYAMAQTPDGAIRRIAIGGTIAGWRLVALTATGARLTRAGSVALSVPFGARAAAVPATPPAEENP